MPNQRISELNEITELRCGCIEEPHTSTNNEKYVSEHDKILLLTAREKISNEKISFGNLKKSTLDNSLLTQSSQNIFGKKVFFDACAVSSIHVSGDNFTTPYYINNEIDESSRARFEKGKILLYADKEIAFHNSGDRNLFFSNDGCLNIGTSRNKGSINAGGDVFINTAHVKNASENYTQLPFEDTEDESICFAHKIQEGTDVATIYLPKTFKYKPIITANLFCSTGDEHIPFAINNVSEYSFDIRFGSTLTSKNYELHVTAHSPSILEGGSFNTTSDAKIIQRFTTNITEESDTHTIQFPLSYNTTPSVHATIETQNNIVSYRISSVNNQQYTLFFDSTIGTGYTIHTFSQENQ